MLVYQATLNQRQIDGTIINTNIDLIVGDSVLEKIDEALDIYSIEVLNKNKETFSMMDTLTLLMTDEDAANFQLDYSIVADDTDLVGRNPDIYLHTIYLSELTKELETYLLPNIGYTQPVDGTLRYATVTSQYDRLINIYNVETDEFFIDTRRYQLEASLRTFMNGIVAPPQHQLKTPTLREALNELFSVFNATVRLLPGNIISADFFNVVSTNINLNEDDIIDYKTNQSFNLYATAIESNAKNIIADNGVNTPRLIFPSSLAWSSIRSEDIIIDENSASINVPDKLSFRKINQVLVKTRWDGLVYDISNFIAEESAYEVLRTENFSSGTTLPFKQNTLKYTYYGNKLFGFGQEFKKGNIPLFATLVWKECFKSAGMNSVSVFGSSLEDYLFKIEYEPIIKDNRIRSYREDLTDINRNVIVNYNQQDTINDVDKFSNQMSGVVQMIGNKEYELTMPFTKLSQLIPPNAFLVNFNAIVTKRELILFENHGIAKYSLTKNFNRINKFIAVDAKRRETDVPVVQDTVYRHLYYEDFVIFNLDGLRNNNSHLTTLGKNSLLNTFKAISGRGIDNVYLATDESGALIQSVDSKAGTNFMRFLFGMDTNIFAGKTIVPNLNNGISGDRDTERGAKYTLDDGTFKRMSLRYGITYGDASNTFDQDEEIGKQLPYVIESYASDDGLVEIGDFSNEENFFLNLTKPEAETISESRTENLSGFISEITFEIELTDGGVPPPSINEFTLVFNVEIDGDEPLGGVFTINDSTVSDTFAVTVSRFVVSSVDYHLSVSPVGTGVDYQIVTSNVKTVKKIPRLIDSLFVDKDPIEVIGQSYQVNLLPKSSVNGEVIIGRSLSKLNNLINGTIGGVEVYVTTNRYERFDKINLKTGIFVGDASVITLGANSISITRTMASNESWAIGTLNGELLIAVNPPRTADFSGIAPTTIDVSLEHQHPEIIYNLFEPDLPSIPAPPSGLAGVAQSATSIKMTWTDNSNNEDGFTIEIQLDDLGWTDLQTLAANVTEFTYNGLIANQLYEFRVRAFNSDGNSNYDTAFVSTDVEVVATPTITEVSKTQTSITVYVTNNDNLTAEIFCDLGINPPTTSRGSIVSLGNTNNITFSGLNPNTTYNIYAQGKNITKLDSNVILKQISTLVSITTATPFVTFDTGATTSSSIRFRVFNDDSSPAELKYGVNNSNPGLFISLGTVAAKTSSSYVTVSGLSPSTNYTVYANAQASGENASAIDSNVETTLPLDLPNAPSNIQLSHDGVVTTTIQWQDNSSNEDGFRVEVSENSGSSWSLLVNTGAGVESTNDFVAAGAGRRDYRVRAFNGDGNSAWISDFIII